MTFQFPDSDLAMTEDMRETLSGTLGPITDLDGALQYIDEHIVASIGDIVTGDLLGKGFVPKIAAVDGKTQRSEKVNVDETAFDHLEDLDNPQGLIVKAVWEKMNMAYKNEGNTLFKVDGEEDLLSIPAIILGPPGAVVLYGVPEKGIGMNDVTEKNRQICIETLRSMEVC